MALEVVTVSLGENTITISLALMPLAFVDVTVGVDHSALTLWHAVYPVSIVSVTVFEKEGSSTVLFVLEPIASILSSKLIILISPVGTLSVLFVHGPHTFVLVTIFVELDSETLFAVVPPVTDVAAGCLPDLALNGAILLSRLLLDPVHTPVRAVLLSLGVTHFPKVDEWRLLLKDHRVLALFIVLLAISTLVLQNLFKRKGNLLSIPFL